MSPGCSLPPTLNVQRSSDIWPTCCKGHYAAAGHLSISGSWLVRPSGVLKSRPGFGRKNYQTPLLRSQPHPHQGVSIKTAKTAPTRKSSFAPLSKDSYLKASNCYKGPALAFHRGSSTLHPDSKPHRMPACLQHPSCLPLPWLPLLLLQGHFFASPGPSCGTSTAVLPVPSSSTESTAMSPAEGSEFLVLCSFGLPRCLVLSGSPTPPQQQPWEESSANRSGLGSL